MALPLASALSSVALGAPLPQTTPPAALFSEMRWRMIGPHRGGRTVAAAGVPGLPVVFYIGVNNGGVWESNDYGRVWRPIFDDQPTGSIGAIAIAPSDPKVIYVGSGEGLHRPDLSTGDGLYRSADSGKTWAHLGLRDGQQIPAILVDPRDPDRVFVAVLGHPFGPNPERGIFRSRDGGRTFEKVLYRDENSGGVDLAFQPGHPDVIYAALWESRQAPWENGVFGGPGSGLYKSVDGGTTWRSLANSGLPGAADGLGRIGLATCKSDPTRMYAVVEAKSKRGGVYRSDDAGENWSRVNEDSRLWGRDGDFIEVKADPKNPDVVYVANVVTWKSVDGGKTFAPFRGAPGGDDYHRLWIDPEDPQVILLTGDQGAIVTVNGGQTWSSWYNQPTAQFYHVSTDSAFPYRVCGGQQESGSACVSSRGDFGQITYRDWRPAGLEEYGYAAPDPLDPDVVYGGRLTRFDRRTGQVQEVGPQPVHEEGYRVLRTAPVLFSPTDPKVLYFASERVWRSAAAGKGWTPISPDLSRKEWKVPPSVGTYAESAAAQPKRRGVVYTVSPSPVDPKTIWAGTDDGLIHVTTSDGASWSDVTPPEVVPWAKVSLIDASHSSALSAYAAVNTLRLDDLRPYIYRTRDGGKTWARITEGIPDGETVNAVREDPQRRGLLFAGTERAVYMSSDDGDHWQSLRLNMPATSVRDLVIKGDDLVVATHGRSFWILDDLTPLRQVDATVLASPAHLLQPAKAVRARWNTNTDTPLPPDEPAGENPPEGAVIDYFLRQASKGPTILEILDARGQVVRRFSSEDVPPPPPPGRNIPDYWIAPTLRLSAAAGLHRFVWDLHWAPPAVLDPAYPIAAVYGKTPLEPRGPWVLPGTSTVRLTVDGHVLTRPLTVVMDPRVKATPAELGEQYARSLGVYHAIHQAREALEGTLRLREGLAQSRGAPGRLGERVASVAAQAQALEGADGDSGGSPGPQTKGLKPLLRDLAAVYDILQGADAAPTPQASSAGVALESAVRARWAEWVALQARAKELNDELKAAGLSPQAP